MKIEPHQISERLAWMLRHKAGREDLVTAGFELEDAAVDRSRSLGLAGDHALYHAIFDRSAAHAAAIARQQEQSKGFEEPETDRSLSAPERDNFRPQLASLSMRCDVLQTVLLIAILIALLTGRAHGQAIPASPMIFVTSDPGGSCTAASPVRYNSANGKLWGCSGGTWAAIGGGGGGTVSQGYTLPFHLSESNASTVGTSANAITCWEFPQGLTQTPSRILAQQYGYGVHHLAWAIYTAQSSASPGQLVFQSSTYTGTNAGNAASSVAWISATQLTAGTMYAICATDDNSDMTIIGAPTNFFSTMMTGYNGIPPTPKFVYTAANPSTGTTTLIFPQSLGTTTASLAGYPNVAFLQ